MTPEEKERIDYEIKAKKEARDKELSEWTAAIALGVFIILLLAIFLDGC